MNAHARQLLFALLLGVIATAGAGCGDSRPGAPAPIPIVKVEPVVERDVPISVEYVGTLVGYINAQIRARVAGHLMSQNYTEGSLVKAGDVMFQVDPRPFQASLDQAEANLLQAESQLSQAKAQVSASQAQVEQALAEVAQYEASSSEGRGRPASDRAGRRPLHASGEAWLGQTGNMLLRFSVVAQPGTSDVSTAVASRAAPSANLLVFFPVSCCSRLSFSTDGDVASGRSKSLAPVGSSHSCRGVRATRNTTASQMGHRITAPMFCP